MVAMGDHVFNQQKKLALNGIDNSKKGSFDKPIHELMVYINNQQNLFTTSSCSGRIIVFSEGDEKKKGCDWLLTSHETVDAKDVIEAVRKDKMNNRMISFKYESFILHLQCKTTEYAQEMLKVALESGYRNSGIVLGKKKKHMVAVRSTHSLEVPLVFDSSVTVSDEYITNLVDLANKKLLENFSRIDKFSENVKKTFPLT